MKHECKKVVLKNGAEGLLLHIPDAQVMTFDLNFRAGEYLVDDENMWEAPHIMEHMLLGANEKYPKSRLFQAEFEKNGAYSNASTGTYQINYESECADFEWDRVLDLLLLAISKPLFLEDEFQAEFGNVREELAGRSNNHFWHLSLAMREAYGFKVKTYQERLKLMEHVTCSTIKKHYKKTHTTSNMRFVIAGNVFSRQEQIIAALEALPLPKGNHRLELPEEIPHSLAKPLYINNPTVDTMYFYFDSFQLKTLTEPEWDALSLLNIMLTETLHSAILGTAREKGLVYNMGSGFGQTRDNVSWWFGTQVRPQSAPELFDLMVEEIRKVNEGKLEQSAVDAAKQYALGRYQRSGQTVGGVSNGYSGRYFFEDVIDDYYMIPERIAGISKDQMIEASRAMFSDRIWGLGVLGGCGPEIADTLQSRLEAIFK